MAPSVVVSKDSAPSTLPQNTPSQTDDLLLLSNPVPNVALVRLNRPRKLNALSGELITTLLTTLQRLDNDESTHVIVLAGLDKPGGGGAFCAGADIAEIGELDAEGAYRNRYLEDLVEGMRRISKVVIGAVEGIALGGGCELALMCDILYSSPTATFSQPELTLGTIPGAGGTQRLLRQLGKAKTLDIVLTGRALTGEEACQAGIVARTFPSGEVVSSVLEIAKGIAERDIWAVNLSKEVVLAGESLGFEAGLKVERLGYWLSFGMEGKKRGVGEFLNRKKAREEAKKKAAAVAAAAEVKTE